MEHIGRYFKYSHTRLTSFHTAQGEWSELQGADTLKKFVKICESAHIRWLTHGKTTSTIRKSFVPLAWGMRHDAGKGDPTAAGLLTELLTFRFVGTMMFMSDIFPMLDKFSLLTQGRAADVDLGVFFRELPLLLERLQYMVDHPEDGRKNHEYFAGLEGQVKEWTTSVDDDGPGLEIKNRGNGAQGSVNYILGLRKQFCLRLIAHLKSRFPEHELMLSLYTLLNARVPRCKDGFAGLPTAPSGPGCQ